MQGHSILEGDTEANARCPEGTRKKAVHGRGSTEIADLTFNICLYFSSFFLHIHI